MKDFDPLQMLTSVYLNRKKVILNCNNLNMYNNINTNSVIYCISNQIDPVLEFGKKYWNRLHFSNTPTVT